MLLSTFALAGAVLTALGVLVSISLAILDLVETHGFTAKGKYKRADISQ